MVRPPDKVCTFESLRNFQKGEITVYGSHAVAQICLVHCTSTLTLIVNFLSHSLTGIVPHVATKANSDFYWMGCLKSVWSSIIVCTQAHPQIQSLRVYRYVQGLKPHHPTMGKVLTLWRPKTTRIKLQNGCPFFQLFMDTKFYIKQK